MCQVVLTAKLPVDISRFGHWHEAKHDFASIQMLIDSEISTISLLHINVFRLIDIDIF